MSELDNNIRVAIVDDHQLLLNGLEELINGFDDLRVVFTAVNRKQMEDQLIDKSMHPHVLLLDIKLKEDNGLELIKKIRQINREIKIVMLTMSDNESNIIKALRLGAVGYLLKDVDSDLFQLALQRVNEDGFYYTHEVNEVMLKALNGGFKNKLNEQETSFLNHACSEMTYKEIASEMFVSPRTIDGYRESLFSKLQIKSRTGLVLYAIKSGIYEIA